jgi:hypothetical protein
MKRLNFSSRLRLRATQRASGRDASDRIGRAAGIHRFVDDPADGPGAPSTLGATAEAAVDFAGAARRTFGCDRADLLVGNDVARTHDHDALSLRSVGLAAAVIQSPCDRTDPYLMPARKRRRKNYDMKSF